MADHTAVSVLFFSVLIFLFFKYCVGEDAGENALGVDAPLALPGSKCPLGSEYSATRRGCKPLVMSSKSLSERMLLLMPYFLRGIEDSSPH